jgi:HD superfamily phosphohydrolase
MKIIKDPLYGFIDIGRKIKKVIEDKEFQRLRYIKQLGFSYLVYPSAVHTRFEHSLGVFYLTNVFLERTKSKLIKEYKNELLLAALLHDIGHGPFSHSSEIYLMKFLKKNHEEIGLKIAIELLERNDINFDKKLFKEIFLGNNISKLIDGDIGTDRLDYLKRDAYHAGVEFGKVDSERIIKNLEFDDEYKEYFIKEKAIYNVYSLLFSRYLMYKTVYLHKTSLLFDKIFGEILELLVNYIDPYLIYRMTDDELFSEIKNIENKRIKELFNRIRYRILPKYKIKFKLKKDIPTYELKKLEEELKEKEPNTWVFQAILKGSKPKIKVKRNDELTELKSDSIIKSITKDNLIYFYVYSDSKLNEVDIRKQIEPFI